MYTLPPILLVQLNRFKQVGTGVVKDCSYCSFEKEIDLGKYVIDEETEKLYGEELKKEVNDIGTDSVGLDNLYDSKTGLIQTLSEIYHKSNPNIKQDLRFDGRYVLYGVILHAGSSTGGHYCAYFRKNNSSAWWYYFDDLNVKEVKWEEFSFIFFFIIFIY
jgi:ubiquitin C-terminal hydrolase